MFLPSYHSGLPYGNSLLRHIGLGLRYGERPEMEDRGGQDSRGMTIPDAFDQMIERAHTARSDDRHFDPVGYPPHQRDVEALAGAVTIHGGHQQFARSQCHDFRGEIQSVDAGGLPPAMGEYLPLA